MTAQSPTLENLKPMIPESHPPALAPDLKVIDRTSTFLVQQAGNLEAITSREQYAEIDALVGKIALARNEVKAHIEEVFGKHIANAYKAHKDLCADRTRYQSEHDKPLAEANAKAIALMRAFEKEEAEREKKLREEAEAKRKADEKAAAEKAEADRKEQLKKDEDARLARAAEAEKNGQTGEAERILNAPPPPPPPPEPLPLRTYYVQPAAIKASNAVSRKNWIGRLKGETPADLRASFLTLVKAAAENPDAFLDFLSLNEKTIKDRAKSQESQAYVPGIEFLNQPTDFAKAGK